ncbi:MAG: hypothetical protein AB8B53_07290 [Flavobacteriales bacterium]
MSENPFKIIEPREELPVCHKTEVIGSVKSVILVLRFVQLFVGDFTTIILDKLKTNANPEQNNKL